MSAGYFSIGAGLISTLRGNRNAFLMLFFSFYYGWIEKLLFSTSIKKLDVMNKTLEMPFHLAACALGLLLLESGANRYLIKIEHYRFQVHCGAKWPAPYQNYYMAFVGLCCLLFRPFFRMTLIIIPVFTPLVNASISYLTGPEWLFKAPFWVVGLWLVWREIKVLIYLSQPETQQPHWLREIAARLVLMTLLAISMSAFKVDFRSFFLVPSSFSIASVLLMLFPFSLFFTMFFLPIRMVEFWVDWVDCRTTPQKTFYISSVVWTVFKTLTK